MTYKDALAANGHDENTDIHYLKIDTEGTELGVSYIIFEVECVYVLTSTKLTFFQLQLLTDLAESGFLKNVWQLHVELHHFTSQYTEGPRLDKMNVSNY